MVYDSVPCDNCGERIEGVPDYCPHCGQAIASRMDPSLREKVHYYMGGTDFPWKRLRLIYISLAAMNLILLLTSELLDAFTIAGSDDSSGLFYFLLFFYNGLAALLTALDVKARVKRYTLHLPCFMVNGGMILFYLTFQLDRVSGSLGDVTRIATLSAVPAFFITAVLATVKAFKKPANPFWALFHIGSMLATLAALAILAFLVFILVNMAWM